MNQESLSLFRYPGSKWGLAPWILSHMPTHEVYIEPFFGSGAVFFSKKPSKLETINDINNEVVNVFRMVRDRHDELAHAMDMTPYARVEYEESYQYSDDPIEQARRFIIRHFMAAFGGVESSAGWSNSTTTNGGGKTNRWRKVPDIICHIHKRIALTQITNEPAIKLLARHDRPDVFAYIDPPYVIDTRRDKLYKYEMTDSDHMELCNAMVAWKGMILLSGYDTDMYNDMLVGWKKYTNSHYTSSGNNRTECLWVNPLAQKHAPQQSFL